MRRLATAVLVGFSAAGLPAACHYGFEADAFNRAVPTLEAETRVFSPFSFEADCVIFAEAADTLSRAAVAEKLGVLSGFDPEYPPILRRLETATNDFSFVCARGFCAPDGSCGDAVFRRMLQRSYGVVTCRGFPVEGANSWFRAAMDGLMEDFSVVADARSDGRFSYYDLVCVRMAWTNPFPLNNSRKLPFVCPDGSRVQLDFMADVRVADTLETSEYLMLRLPLRGGMFFHALLPRGEVSLDDLRREVSSAEIRTLLASMGSVADPGVLRGPTVVVIPRLELDTTLDMAGLMHDCRCPIQGLTGVVGNSPPRELVQRVRFTLLEHAIGERPLREKPVASQLPIEKCVRKAVLNRPFLFFVIDETTETIPVMGQFTGRLPVKGPTKGVKKKEEKKEEKKDA